MTRVEDRIQPPRRGERSGALAAVGGVMLLANATAARTGAFDNGVRGALLSWTDLGAVLLLVTGGYVLGERHARARASGSAPPAAFRRLLGLGVGFYPLWWLCAVVSLAIVKPGGGPGQLLTTLVLFRDPRSIGPLRGVTIGWILLVLAVAAVVVPLWSRVLDRSGATRRGLRGELVGHAVLAIVGVVARAVFVAAGATSLFGPLSHLPGQLTPLAVGLGLAAVSAHDPSGRLLGARRRLLGLAAGLSVVAWFLLAVAGGDATGSTGFGRLVVRPTVQAALAGIVAAWWLLAPPRSAVARRAALTATLAAPGLVLLHEPILDLLARQYRERTIDLGGATRLLTGPVTPPFVWSLLVSAAAGVVLSVAVRFANGRRLYRGLRPDQRFATALGTVCSAAFLWRVVALLAIAPERTDGGDPLFYHTTANLLAEGRGFPEPLNWIAYGKQIPSALHGPLYPVVLSLSSRLGGTTYFDHKMISLLIGTLTVCMVGLVARRLGGPVVGVAAALLAAFYPNLWVIDSVLFPEGLFALATTLLIFVAYRWRDRPGSGGAALMGALIGISSLARGEGMFLTVLLVAPWVLLHRTVPIRRRITHLVVAGVACALALAPWVGRNMVRFESFVPLSTNGQELLVYANCDETYSGKFLGYWYFDCQTEIRRELGGEPPGDEAQKAAYWGARGREYIRAHLGELPKVVAARVGRQWELFRPIQNAEFAGIEGRSVGWAKAGLAYYYVLAAAAVAGAVALRRRGLRLLPLGAQVASVTITAAYAYGNTRFRASAEPVLCILAAVALVPLARTGLARARALVARSADHPGTDRLAFVAGGSGGLRGAGAWRQWLPLAIVAAVIAAPVRGMYTVAGATMEEGFMLTFPERVLHGDIPNVDFLHLYGPGSLHALAFVYKIFGVSMYVERTYGLAQHIGIILGLYVLLRAWGRVAAVLGAVLSVFLVLTPIGLTALAWNGAVALGLWSVVAALRARSGVSPRPRLAWLAAGILGGLALTFRPDLAVALVLAHSFLLWRQGALRRVAAGVGIGLLPMIVHVVIAGPRASFTGMFLDPVAHLRPGRELPRPPSWDHFDGALQVIADKFPPWWKVPHLPGPQQIFWWFFLLPVVAVGVLVAAVLVRRRTAPGEAARTRLDVLVGAAAFAFGLLPQAFQRPDSAHLAWVSCVCFPLAVVALHEVVAVVRPSVAPLGRTLAGAVAVAMSMLVVFPYFSYRPYFNSVRQSLGQLPTGKYLERDGRVFYLGDTRPWHAAQEVIADLDRMSTPGERLLVGTVDLRQTIYSDVFFYYLFPELPPATYYIEFDPGLANEQGTRLAEDVASADWLLLTRYWSGWIEPNTSVVFGDDRPNQVVEDQFCLRGTYQNDLIRLYHRCAQGDGIGPYEGPYEPAYDYAVEVSVPVPPRPDGTSPFAPGAFVPFSGG